MSRIALRLLSALVGLVAISSILAAANVSRGSGSASLQASSDAVRRVTPEEVRELMKNSKAVLIDVRGESSYKAGHIKGALFIPFAEIRNRAKELPKDKTILTYCS